MPRSGSKRKKTRTHVTIDYDKEGKVPKSIVVKRGAVGKSLGELVQNVRRIMLPYTALHLVETRNNTIKDYVNVAGPLGVSHIIVLSQQTKYPKMRLGCYPHGPTLHFRITDYSLMKDIMNLHAHPPDVVKPFQVSPAVIINNFPQDSKPLQLVVTTFKNMFPVLDPSKMKVEDCKRVLLLHYEKETDSILLRHYIIKQTIVGVSKSVEDLLHKQIPNLGDLNDISEYALIEQKDAPDGPGSEIPNAMGQIRTAVKLIEVGPRLCMKLIKVEKELYDGECIYTREDNEEKKDVIKQSIEAKKTKEMEKTLIQEEKEQKRLQKELKEEKKEQMEERGIVDFTKEKDSRRQFYGKKNKKDEQSKEKFTKPLPKKNIKQRTTVLPSRPASKHSRK